MGREVVLANIRKRMIAMIVGGVILTLMGGFISFAAVVAGEYSVLILGLFALTPGVIFLIFGTSRRTHPEKSGIFKANPDLLQQADELYANNLNFMSIPSLEGEMRAKGKIRYSHEGSMCTIRMFDENTLECTFDEPVRAVTPGQALVLYDGDNVLGGGTII